MGGDASDASMQMVRAVVQRVSSASVVVDDSLKGSIGEGLLLLVGVAPTDTATDAAALADKVAVLRIFPDDTGLMNRSLFDVEGSCLIVSQFTLFGSVRKGRRPSFTGAAAPSHAEPLVELVAENLRGHEIHVESGTFGAMMEVSLVNSGPVTFIIDTEEGRVV